MDNNKRIEQETALSQKEAELLVVNLREMPKRVAKELGIAGIEFYGEDVWQFNAMVSITTEYVLFHSAVNGILESLGYEFGKNLNTIGYLGKYVAPKSTELAKLEDADALEGLFTMFWETCRQISAVQRVILPQKFCSPRILFGVISKSVIDVLTEEEWQKYSDLLASEYIKCAVKGIDGGIETKEFQ